MQFSFDYRFSLIYPVLFVQKLKDKSKKIKVRQLQTIFIILFVKMIFMIAFIMF